MNVNYKDKNDPEDENVLVMFNQPDNKEKFLEILEKFLNGKKHVPYWRAPPPEEQKLPVDLKRRSTKKSRPASTMATLKTTDSTNNVNVDVLGHLKL